MLPEEALFKIGSWVAVSVAKRWVKDHTGQEATSDTLLRLINENWATERERRRAQRQFDRIAEQVVESLTPFLESEFSDREPLDVEAAVYVAGDFLQHASLDLDDFLAADLDGDKIVSDLSSEVAAAGDTALLSPSGRQVLRAIVAETVTYLVEISSTLPEFQSAAARELLKRESQIVDLVTRVLEEIPKHSMSEWASSEDREFETIYRREINRRMDRLELFGVKVSELSKRYALSVAYISLDLVTRRTGDDAGELDNEFDVDVDVSTSAEDAVADSPRLLIRGEAGSGKTTLLRWLAVQSARRTFLDDLEPFNELIPFYLPLRQFVGQDLPLPEEFVKAGAPNISGKMPVGWVHRQLERGTAVILIDGLDELPEEDRIRSRDWLRELIESFPNCRYVVTTRPPAVSNDWLAAEDFRESDLQPMDVPAIDSFIRHWFAAAKDGASSDDECAELDRFETKLQSVIRENAALRGLATSPLLCAMICALHRDRRTNLPTHRMELYRIALEMLLDRRDVERNVPGELETDIALPDKLGILSELAYWLILNNLSDATVEDFKQRLDIARARFQRIEASTDEVFDHLLLRSGLLRQPIEGRVDFIHRTFQEYLGARQAVEENSIPLLIESAHLAQWREVVILAAGHCQNHQRTALLDGLLRRADDEFSHRHALELLAISCMETSSTLDNHLKDELRRRLVALVPPRNLSDAKALASAGEIAVPLLQGHNAAKVARTAATVRALASIGGDGALDALAEYGADARRGVYKELIRAWTTFDPGDYAERVLADSPLDGGILRISTSELVPHLHHLRNLRSLILSLRDVTDEDLRPLHQVSSCKSVQLWRAFGVTTLSALEPSRGLAHLALREAGVTDLTPLRGMGSLKVLLLQDCPEVDDLTVASDLEGLSELTLNGTSVSDLRPLADHPSLSSVRLFRGSPENLDVLQTLPALATLELGSLGHDLTWVGGCDGLESLRLAEEDQSLVATASSASVTSLELGAADHVDLNMLKNFPALSDLTVEDCLLLTGLEGLRHAKLQRLQIPAVSKADYTPLQHLEGCAVTTHVSVLSQLPDYRSFIAQNEVSVFYDFDLDQDRQPELVSHLLDADVGVKFIGHPYEYSIRHVAGGRRQYIFRPR
ncbi:MAG: NACHT domain-containing protein [Comamonadaceae bacterium]|nr:MAG: NACHT domain-containing protein [Comamonadaceae bacterium]